MKVKDIRLTHKQFRELKHACDRTLGCEPETFENTDLEEFYKQIDFLIEQSEKEIRNYKELILQMRRAEMEQLSGRGK